MDVRVSLVDFRMGWRAVEEAHRVGRGALQRSAVAFGVRRAVVKAALDRIEAALGGIPFFEVQVRRSGVLTPAGDAFRQKGPRLISAWEAMLSQGSIIAQNGEPVTEELGRMVVTAARPAATMADLVEAVGRQGRRLEDILASVEASQTDTRRDGPAPAGTKAADTMRMVLGILKEAGAVGVGSRELAAALQAAGVRSGTAEAAKAALRSAGLARCEKRRWYLAAP